MIPKSIIIPPTNWMAVKYSPNNNQARNDAVTGSLIRVNEASPVLTFPSAHVINPIPINWLINAKQKIISQPFKETGRIVSLEKITINKRVTALNKVPNKNII